MATVPNLATYYAGARWRAADVNTFGTAVNFANKTYACRVYNGSTQSIATGGGGDLLTFGSEYSDAYGWHDAGLPERITPAYPGWYHIVGNVSFATNATGLRLLTIQVNSPGAANVTAAQAPATASCPVSLNVSTVVYLNGTTDYVTMLAYQNSGAALNTSIITSATYFTAVLLGA